MTLTTTEDEYPIFRGVVRVPAQTAFEYKYVVVAEEGVSEIRQQWEAVNRSQPYSPSPKPCKPNSETEPLKPKP